MSDLQKDLQTLMNIPATEKAMTTQSKTDGATPGVDVTIALEARQDAYECAQALIEDGYERTARPIINALTLLDTAVVNLEKENAALKAKVAAEKEAREAIHEMREKWIRGNEDLYAALSKAQEALAMAILWALDNEGGYSDFTKEYYDWATAVKDAIPGNPQVRDVLRAALKPSLDTQKEQK